MKFAEASEQDTVVWTDKRRPVAALVSLRKVDRESLALSTNLQFLRIIETARNEIRSGSTISLKKEYDFSKGERGKFYRPGVELNIPVYLEPDVAKVVRQRARKTDASMGAVVNEWLREDIRSGSHARNLKARQREA